MAMPIRWAVAEHMTRAGIENANQLAKKAGLSYPVASRILAGEDLERIDVATLEALAAAFGVKPWTLLEHTLTKR